MKKIFSFLAIMLIAMSSFAVITITPATIDTGYCEHSYSFKCTASGGSAPYVYSVSVGSLPSGLFLNRTSGLIEGIIHLQTTTSVSFTILATDKLGATGSRAYTMYIRNTALTGAQLTSIWSGTYPVAYSNVFDTWYNVFTKPTATTANKWDLSGNTLSGLSSIKLGSLDSSDFSIVTENTDRMVFKADGSIGIGTGSPTTKLHINGTSAFRYVDGQQGNGKILLSSATGVGSWQEPTFWNKGGNTVASEQQFGTVDNFDIPFITNNTRRMTISNTGWVGINQATQTTIEKFYVNGYSIINGRLDQQGDIYLGGSGFSIITSPNYNFIANMANGFEFANTAGATKIMTGTITSGKARINIANIPSDSTGLTTGDIYRGAGGAILFKY